MSIKSDFKRKTETRRTITLLERQIERFERRQKEYLQTAKSAKQKGNSALYATARSMLGATIAQTRRLELMHVKIKFASEQSDFAENNRAFIKGMGALGKALTKTVQSADISGVSVTLEKSMLKLNTALAELDGFLDGNQASDMTSALSDSELDSIIDGELRASDSAIDAQIENILKNTPVNGTRNTAEKVAVTESVPVLQPQSSANRADAPNGSAAANNTIPNNVAENNNFAQNNNGAQNPNGEFAQGNGGSRPLDKKVELSGSALRPQRFCDYIGQERAINVLRDPVKKARLLGSPLPHVLLCGSYGQGKTTLARIISNEMGAGFVELPASVKPPEMIKTLKSLNDGDILFIDEVHKLMPDVVETVLYPAIEDFELHLVENNGGKTRAHTVKINRFTLIGATTESGKLLKPFYSKFPLKITLEEYTERVMATIVKNGFAARGGVIDDDAAFEIAKRSRGIPRLAGSFTEGVHSMVLVREAERRGITSLGHGERLVVRASKSDVLAYFKQAGYDALGLGDFERKLMLKLLKTYGGGPIGQETLSKALDISENRLGGEYEPYLVKLGFITITPQGRYATDKAFEYFGIFNPRKHRAAKRNAEQAASKNKNAAEKLSAEQNAHSEKNGTADKSSNTADAALPANSADKNDGAVMPPTNNADSSNNDGALAFGKSSAGSETVVFDHALAKNSQNESATGTGCASNGDDSADGEDNGLTVVEVKEIKPDKDAAARLLALFNGDARPIAATLDELFDGAAKSYDSTAANRCILKFGKRELYCDSKLERRFMEYMFSSGCAADAKSEALELSYATAHMADKRYFPDFVIKLTDGRVAIAELKNMSSMGYHLNIAKYDALKAFCVANGYLYAEIGKDYEKNRYVSAEQLKSRAVNSELKNYVLNKIAQNDCCSADDIKAFGCSDEELITLLLNERGLKNVDRTGAHPVIVQAD